MRFVGQKLSGSLNRGAMLIIIPLCLFVVSVAIAYHLDFLGSMGGEIVGSLIGVLGLVLALGLERFFIRRKEESDKQDDVEKILAVIGAELENVACGLINFKEFLMSLDFSIGSLYEHMPPPLPFTDMLGAKLVLLDKKQVEVLFLLKAKLSTQASYMQ